MRCSTKEGNNRQNEKAANGTGTIFANNISGKGLISKYIRNSHN